MSKTLKKYCCASYQGGTSYGSTDYDDYECPCRKGVFTISDKKGLTCGLPTIHPTVNTRKIKLADNLYTKYEEYKFLGLSEDHPLYWSTFTSESLAREAMHRVNQLLGED